MAIPSGNEAQFFGTKVSRQGIPVQQASDSQLLYKNDLDNSIQTWYNSAGSVAMQQGKLTGGAYGLSFPTNNGGTLTFGALADGNFGINVQDSSGFTLFEMSGSTWYWYDKTYNVNVMQVGLLPDGTYGMAVAKQGINVSAAF